MCTGAILLYKIPRVVIGENKTFLGGEDLLRQRGVEVVVLDSQECKDLMAKFIEEHPEVSKLLPSHLKKILTITTLRSGMRILANREAPQFHVLICRIGICYHRSTLSLFFLDMINKNNSTSSRLHCRNWAITHHFIFECIVSNWKMYRNRNLSKPELP